MLEFMDAPRAAVLYTTVIYIPNDDTTIKIKYPGPCWNFGSRPSTSYKESPRGIRLNNYMMGYAIKSLY